MHFELYLDHFSHRDGLSRPPNIKIEVVKSYFLPVGLIIKSENLIWDFENMVLEVVNAYLTCIWRGASPPAPPFGSPGARRVWQGLAEYRWIGLHWFPLVFLCLPICGLPICGLSTCDLPIFDLPVCGLPSLSFALVWGHSLA